MGASKLLEISNFFFKFICVPTYDSNVFSTSYYLTHSVIVYVNSVIKNHASLYLPIEI